MCRAQEFLVHAVLLGAAGGLLLARLVAVAVATLGLWLAYVLVVWRHRRARRVGMCVAPDRSDAP